MNASNTPKVEKGIPAPTAKTKYPFAEMDVGDSFACPRDRRAQGDGRDVTQNAISACAAAYAKRHNPTAKFTTRLIDENTVRCWRVA